MLLVKTRILPSKIHGLGLFADQFIPTGTEIWRFTPGIDLKLTREQILALPKLAQICTYTYGYRSKKSGLYIYSSDGARHINHSDHPNSISEYRDTEEEAVTVALKDIKPREEILDNYNSFEFATSDGDVLDEIAKKYQLQGDIIDPRLVTRQ